MIRLARSLLFVTLAFGAGMAVATANMHEICRKADGVWRDGVCHGRGIRQ